MTTVYDLFRRPTAVDLRDLGFVPTYELPTYDGPPEGDIVEEWVMPVSLDFMPYGAMLRVEPVTSTDDDGTVTQYVEGGVPCHRYWVRIPSRNGGEYQPLGWYEFDGTGVLGFVAACYAITRSAEFDAFFAS